MTPITVYTAYICIFDVIWMDKWKHLFVRYCYLHLRRVVPPAPGVLPHRVIGHLLLLEPVLQGVDHGPWNKICLVLKNPPHCKKRGGGYGTNALELRQFCTECVWHWAGIIVLIYPLLNEVTPNLKLKIPLTKDVYTKNAYLDRKNKSMKRTSTDIVIMKVLKM